MKIQKRHLTAICMESLIAIWEMIRSPFQTLQKTIELSPYHENAYFERGLVQHSLGNYLAAFNDFYEHTKYNLEEERTLVAKVNSLLAIEDYSKAFPYYEQLVPLVPDVTLHQINLALCYIETGNLKDGKINFRCRYFKR